MVSEHLNNTDVVKKKLPGDNRICCVIGSPSSQQTSTSQPCPSMRISKCVKSEFANVSYLKVKMKIR